MIKVHGVCGYRYASAQGGGRTTATTRGMENWAGGEQGSFMGANGFFKVRVTKDSEELIPISHPSRFAMPPAVTVVRKLGRGLRANIEEGRKILRSKKFVSLCIPCPSPALPRAWLPGFSCDCQLLLIQGCAVSSFPTTTSYKETDSSTPPLSY